MRLVRRKRQNRREQLGGDWHFGSEQDRLQRALARIRRTEPACELLASCPRFEFHPRRFVRGGVEVRVVPIERHLLKDARFRATTSSSA